MITLSNDAILANRPVARSIMTVPSLVDWHLTPVSSGKSSNTTLTRIGMVPLTGGGVVPIPIVAQKLGGLLESSQIC